MLWGRPPHDFTKASVLVLTKHARKIAMNLAPEKALLYTLPMRQFYDAGTSLITRTGTGPSNTGPSL